MSNGWFTKARRACNMRRSRVMQCVAAATRERINKIRATRSAREPKEEEEGEENTRNGAQKRLPLNFELCFAH